MNSAITYYLRLALTNFIVLTVLGLVLRYMHIADIDGVNYQFLLHAHSHFAFAGWMFFAIALLIISLIDKNTLARSFKWVMILALISAYGMLVSFYLQGYKAVSITFSTLFIIVTYRFTYLVFKSKILKNGLNPLSAGLISASLIFLCLSSAGPFALGPLMALGLKNTPWYQDAIYIYLHFQMNGFMLLAGWGMFASVWPNVSLNKASKTWLKLFVWSTAALYFIFTLWSKPGVPFQALAAAGAIVNLVSWLMLCIGCRDQLPKCSLLVKAALAATTLKCIFQVIVCIPGVGEWVFSNRDLIIGYIHLLTLGIISPLILDQMIRRGFLKRSLPLVWIYIGAAVVYVALLFLQPFLARLGVLIPDYEILLFAVSLVFLFIAVVFFFKFSFKR
ncbi:MAG: hypothetical protein JSU01_22335 [Bacteroidetes bacterium]|nr:hypothetical protein [Bacteroidota bacterium]